MRELKFRIICEDLSGERLVLYRTLNDLFNEKLSNNGRIENIISQDQYTGLHDKNGQPIYERDLVRHHTDFNIEVHGEYVDYEVIYRNGCWMVSYHRSATGQTLPKGYTCGSVLEIFQREDRPKEFYFTDHARYNSIPVEVIGTIHD